MKATMKVSKASLKKKLNERKAELRRDFEDNSYVKELSEAIERHEKGETEEAFANRLSAWHREVAEKLDAGQITFTRTGQLRGAPIKPQFGKIQTRFVNWTIDDLRSQMKSYERQLEASLRPIDTAIELLNMAAGTQVEIDTSDYQELLSDSGSRRYY